nr:metal ABC transporter substrate-binding protein [uncultured Peptostreptococcus sp.]
MKKLGLKLSAVLLATSFALAGCAGDKTANTTEKKDGGKLKVYASFYPMYDFAKKIGGDKVEVTNLVPAGTEPHDWEPSAKDLAKISESDILVYSGAGMESWVDKVDQATKNSKLVKVEASKGIDLIKSEHHHDHEDADDKDHEEHEHGEYDPHVWLSPQNAKTEMKNIKDALVKADAANKDYYEKNFEIYSKKIDELDKKFSTSLKDTKSKNIVVSHEAFGYLCKAYGINQVGIEGLSPDSEPDAARMAEVTKFAKENKVKYIFFEELVSPKVSETIAKEVGAKTAVLNPLEGLSDEQIKAGEDYFTIMESNLKVLLEALNA